MPVMRDGHCGKCQRFFELIFDSYPYPKNVPCDCGGEITLVWKSFGARGRVGGDKGRFPFYDVQSGKTFNSSKEIDQYARRKGYHLLGRDEAQRTMNNHHEPEPRVDEEKLRDTMEEAFAEHLKGAHVPHKIVDGNSFRWIGDEK